MEASRWPMVIEPLSLTFFRVPSCAAAGTARARARAARISVIGRVMAFSLWPSELAAGCGAARFYGSPPFLVQAGLLGRATANASGGLKSGLEPPEGAGHMNQVATRIEHDLL